MHSGPELKQKNVHKWRSAFFCRSARNGYRSIETNMMNAIQHVSIDWTWHSPYHFNTFSSCSWHKATVHRISYTSANCSKTDDGIYLNMFSTSFLCQWASSKQVHSLLPDHISIFIKWNLSFLFLLKKKRGKAIEKRWNDVANTDNFMHDNILCTYLRPELLHLFDRKHANHLPCKISNLSTHMTHIALAHSLTECYCRIFRTFAPHWSPQAPNCNWLQSKFCVCVFFYDFSPKYNDKISLSMGNVYFRMKF